VHRWLVVTGADVLRGRSVAVDPGDEASKLVDDRPGILDSQANGRLNPTSEAVASAPPRA